jgi:membrane protein DedA with SNARE-associated domain
MRGSEMMHMHNENETPEQETTEQEQHELATQMTLLEQRPRWTWILIAGVIGLYVLGLTTTALTSRMLKDEQYLQLIALSPRYRNFIAGSSKIDFVPFLTVGVARLLVSDPLYFLIGKYFGDSALRWFEKLMGGPEGGGKLISTTERWFHLGKGRVAMVLSAFFAGPIICILAGATKMKAKQFFVLDFFGTIVVVLLLRLLAKPLTPAVDWLIDVNKQYWKWFTLAAVGFVALSLMRGGKDYVKNASTLGKD